jgi:putative transposase
MDAHYDELIRQGKLKRIFRAKQKLTVPDIVSHITQRAAGKDPLFLEETDYLFMLANMKDITQKRSLDIYAFCLMPNHIHLLASPREDELHESMRDLFSRYAMMFNRKYERKGHLFAGPYRQAVCLEDAYLLVASLYIHINPVRAGLVEDPVSYRWSSVKLFSDPGAPQSFVKPGFVLRLLNRDPHSQKEIYANLLKKSLSVQVGDSMEEADAVGRLRKALTRAFPTVFSRVAKKKNIAKRTGLELLDEESVKQAIDDMKTQRKRVTLQTRKARRFLIEQLIARGYKREDIAGMLDVSVKTVYNTLKDDALHANNNVDLFSAN